MEMEGIKRLVFESSIGIGDSWDHLTWFTRWVFVPLLIRNIFADKEIQERVIMESELDWVIVRPGRLTNGPQRGAYRMGDEISETAKAGAISRADVAEFMLRQVTSDEFVHKTPEISY